MRVSLCFSELFHLTSRQGGLGWAVSRHCPALLAALWVVVAALQEWWSWEEGPPFRSPPARRETHTHVLPRKKNLRPLRHSKNDCTPRMTALSTSAPRASQVLQVPARATIRTKSRGAAPPWVQSSRLRRDGPWDRGAPAPPKSRAPRPDLARSLWPGETGPLSRLAPC